MEAFDPKMVQAAVAEVAVLKARVRDCDVSIRRIEGLLQEHDVDEDFTSDSFTIKEWRGKYVDFKPVREVASRDESADYEIQRAHVFALERGNFALVTEIGCSCYTSSDAGMDFYPTERAAMDAFEKWFKR